MKEFEYRGRKAELMTQDAEWTRKNGIDIWIEQSSGSGLFSFREMASTLPGAEKRAKQIIDAEVEK